MTITNYAHRSQNKTLYTFRTRLQMFSFCKWANKWLGHVEVQQIEYYRIIQDKRLNNPN